MNNAVTILQDSAIDLLKKLIATPSFSKEEDATAAIIAGYLNDHGVRAEQIGNNVYALNKHFDGSKPTLLLNSHHDTVRPNKGYTVDPFEPLINDEKLFGLGSNDAGGCLVSLLSSFLHFYDNADGAYNVIFAGSAEEEISGTGGIELLLPLLPAINSAIVGEPTKMNLAVAERGLLVIDCMASGKAGHAAREEGDNAILHAIHDIEWIYAQRFEKVSHLLGPVKMSVTVIETDNKQHNVVPSSCKYVIDARVNELYTFDEILLLLQNNLRSSVQARSTRLRSTSIALDHPLVKAGLALGKTYYGSPTTSDKALMPFPALKVGPGDSARSHTADEYIYLSEIRDGISDYIRLIDSIL